MDARPRVIYVHTVPSERFIELLPHIIDIYIRAARYIHDDESSLHVYPPEPGDGLKFKAFLSTIININKMEVKSLPGSKFKHAHDRFDVHVFRNFEKQ